MSDVRAFSAPTRIVAGLGSLDRLGPELRGARRAPDRDRLRRGRRERRPARARCSPGSRRRRRRRAAARPARSARGARRGGGRSRRAAGCDAVVGIGGGSALALSKAVALLLRNESPITSYAGWDKAPLAPAPSIALPTTAGSGSEVSNALVLHDPAQESIVVIRGHGYEPRVAILDGALLRTLPRAAARRSGPRRAQPRGRGALGARREHVHGRARHGRRRSAARDAAARARGANRRRPPAAARGERDGEPGLRQLGARPRARDLVGHAPARARTAARTACSCPGSASFNRGALGRRALEEGERLFPLYERIGFEPSLRPGDLAERGPGERDRGGAREPAAPQQQPPRDGGRAGGDPRQRRREGGRRDA